MLQAVAGAALLGVAALHLGGRRAHTAPAGLVLRSFIMSTAHGAGLMLVPALIPLCFGDAPAREITASGSLTLALLAVGVHTVAMLDVTALIATGACRGVDAVRRHGLRPLAIAALAGRGGAPASEEPFTEALSTRRE